MWLVSTDPFDYGVSLGLALAPVDYQQGNSYRIIYLHVPVAFLAQALYAAMAVCAVVLFVWKMKLADVAMQSIAVMGLAFTALSLISGAVWGQTNMGHLLGLGCTVNFHVDLGVFVSWGHWLTPAIQDPDQAGKACGILVLVGVVNLPIIKYSVEWWNTLHQPASLKLTEKPAMPASMWIPLLVNIVGYYVVAAYLILGSMRAIVLERGAPFRLGEGIGQSCLSFSSLPLRHFVRWHLTVCMCGPLMD